MGFLRKNKDKTAGVKLSGFFIFLVIAAVLLGMKFGMDWQQYKTEKNNHQTEVTSDAIRQAMEQSGELISVSYYYTNMAKFEDYVAWLDHQVPFTTKSFILSYDGVIKAGIQLNQVEINVTEGLITLTLPDTEILTHEVDYDSMVLYDEKNSIFNGLSAEDVTDFMSSQNSLMEEKAINNGILETAKEYSIDNLTMLVESITAGQEIEIIVN